MRIFESEEDFWKVRNLLIQPYPLTPVDWNWEIRRWDGWHFHRENPVYHYPEIGLWETEDGQIVGAVHPDYRHLIEADMRAASSCQKLKLQKAISCVRLARMKTITVAW